MSYLEAAGFGSRALFQIFNLKANLISILVELWRPKTRTFHLSCRESTITLEDISMQLGLLVDSDVVTGQSKMVELSALCYQLLGHSPGDGEAKFTYLKFSWLNENFQQLSSSATKFKMICIARAYILQLIGGSVQDVISSISGLPTTYVATCK
ncbi:hypothetical protein J1N35_040524 [Gossypium stocksii]|uniref:Aminotransferase-like plant mobile domain-containing protein n=1 Tax=Gossypium stocksii TaxID=47602 RepID=A0A9D3UDR2_9ROSI|nr:hypothetical protein J1N35_040524 [Gossypium stocksii]